MKCPTCDGMELAPRKTTHGLVYQCPSCAFLFADQKTLEAFSDDHARFQTAFEEAYEYKLATARTCPKCKGKLQQGRSKSAGLIFTFCPVDSAVWIDFRTLAVFDRALERVLREQVDLAAQDAAPKLDVLDVEPPKANPFAKALKSVAKSLEKTADRMGANMPAEPKKEAKKEPKKPEPPKKKPEEKKKEEPVVKSVEPLPPPVEAPKPVEVPTPPVPKEEPKAEPVPVVKETPKLIEAPKPAPVKPKPFVSPAPKKPGFFSQLFSGPKTPAPKKAEPTKPIPLPAPVPPPEPIKQVEPPKPVEAPKPVKPAEPPKPVKPVEPPKPVEAPKPAKPAKPIELPKPVEPPKPSLPPVIASWPKEPFQRRAILAMPTILPFAVLILHWLTAYEFEWFYAVTWMVWTWSLARMVKISVLYSKKSLQEFKGRLAGTKEKGAMRWDLVIEEKGLPLDRHSGWNLAAALFGVSNLTKLQDKETVVHGWLRGKKIIYLEVRDLSAEGTSRTAMSRGLHWTFTVVVFLISSLILYSGY